MLTLCWSNLFVESHQILFKRFFLFLFLCFFFHSTDRFFLSCIKRRIRIISYHFSHLPYESKIETYPCVALVWDVLIHELLLCLLCSCFLVSLVLLKLRFQNKMSNCWLRTRAFSFCLRCKGYLENNAHAFMLIFDRKEFRVDLHATSYTTQNDTRYL